MTAAQVHPSGAQLEIAHGDARAWVVEAGGGLRAYRVGDHDVVDGYAADERCTDARGQCLIPWPNRLRNGCYRFDGVEHQLPLSEPARRNAIHGLVRWTSWGVAAHAPDAITMRHVLHPQDGYPFTLRIEVEYGLSEDGLAVRTTATNAGGERCPFGAGAHPYVTVGGDHLDTMSLRAPGATLIETDERGIPTATRPAEGTPYDFRTPRPIGATVLDTAYSDLERAPDGRARVELERLHDGGGRTTVWLDDAYPYLMLFTGDSLPDPARRRRGLGVEPMTCAPDAFRSGDGLRVLEPGESWTGSWGISAG
jgi:aldose 1-epimerase